MKRTSENINYDESTEKLVVYAKALAHPTRVAILKFLEKKSCSCAGDLQDLFPLAQSTISQHIKELKNAGLIEGELKSPKINYRINSENWSSAKKLFQELFDLRINCESQKNQKNTSVTLPICD